MPVCSVHGPVCYFDVVLSCVWHADSLCSSSTDPGTFSIYTCSWHHRVSSQKLLQQYGDGRITISECVRKVCDSFEYSFSADDIHSVSLALPVDVREAIKKSVATAPRTTEEWARFRMRRGVGVFENDRIPFSDEESAFADSQAHYYRFVTAWRKTLDG